MPKRPFAAVFFDAGHTLFEERPSRFEIYARAARGRGLDVDAARAKAAMLEVHAALPLRIDGAFRYTEGWFRVFIDEVFARLGYAGDAAALQRELLAAFESRATFELYPEVRAVVKRLKGAGLTLGVVSNWGPKLPAILGRLGIGQDFGVIVTSAVAQVEKPDPAIFRRACAELGVEPARALHVGDHAENDVAGAEAAGLEALLLDRAGPDALAACSIRDLDGVLSRLGLPPTRPEAEDRG